MLTGGRPRRSQSFWLTRRMTPSRSVSWHARGTSSNNCRYFFSLRSAHDSAFLACLRNMNAKTAQYTSASRQRMSSNDMIRSELEYRYKNRRFALLSLLLFVLPYLLETPYFQVRPDGRVLDQPFRRSLGLTPSSNSS